MLVFGHLGLTLSAGLITSSVITLTRHIKYNNTNFSIDPLPAKTSVINKINQQFSTLSKYLDIRLLLVGAILPDLLDKPLGHYVLPAPFDGGRIFGHTLLFLLLITLAASYVHIRYRKTYLYALSFGVLMHLITDEMWLSHETLLWPIFGVAFESSGVEDWLNNVFHVLFTYPSVYIPETIGFLIIGWFSVQLLQRKNVTAFVKHGIIT